MLNFSLNPISPHVTIHISPEIATSKFTHVNTQEYFEGHVAQNVSQAFSDMYPLDEYPTCALSGRVKASSTLSVFHDFIGKTEPEMSVNEDRIKACVDTIHQRTYSKEFLSNPELPYEVLAGFARGELSVWEVSNVLIWHQLTIDYPDIGLSIVPLLDGER